MDVKRHSLLVVATAAVIAVLLSASAGQSSRKDGTAPAPGVYTYDQAVAAGITLSLRQALDLSGLPLCPPPSEGTGGYPTGKALRDAIAHSPEAPTCMADPRLATFSVCNENCIHSGGLIGPGIRLHRR
jgi:hypothetical protein